MVNHLEITVEVIIHATEDRKKILDSIFTIFEIKEDEFTEEKLVGHFGNTILLLKTKLTKKRAQEFIRNVISKISKVQMTDFFDNIDMHFEGSSLFLRISKQDIIRNTINIQQNDAMKIKISMPVYKKSDLVKNYRDLLKS
ncbi:MAG TPA: RNA-binding domain-containing protein [Nitrosopumilaceae archaeon]|nr:RNA-binding domain-containing protein [Nitrosopumilaceae archaeon]